MSIDLIDSFLFRNLGVSLPPRQPFSFPLSSQRTSLANIVGFNPKPLRL